MSSMSFDGAGVHDDDEDDDEEEKDDDDDDDGCGGELRWLAINRIVRVTCQMKGGGLQECLSLVWKEDMGAHRCQLLDHQYSPWAPGFC